MRLKTNIAIDANTRDVRRHKTMKLVQIIKLMYSRYLGYKLLRVQFNLLKPAGHVMHQQFNIQQLYVLPSLYLCVLYLSENKQRLVPLTA